MKAAIFTDNDFTKVNGVTTTLRAVLTHAPADIQVRVYTCESRGCKKRSTSPPDARGLGIPFYREMKVHLPPGTGVDESNGRGRRRRREPHDAWPGGSGGGVRGVQAEAAYGDK